MSYTLNDQIIAIEAELTSLLEIKADDTYMGFSSLSDDEDFISKLLYPLFMNTVIDVIVNVSYR